ncbi:hypothetical protein BMT54_12045, partial [Pasteurellaceae bacterium 15-036681]
ANGGLTVANGQTVNMGNNRVQGVANGTEDTDAVNLSQLNATKQSLTNAGLNFAANVGDVARKLGETLTIKGSLAADAVASSKNVRTEVKDGKIEVLISENPEFETLTTTGDVTVGGNQTVSGSQTVKGDSTVEGNQTVKGDSTVEGNQTVKGDSTVEGNQTVKGDSTVEGSQTVKKDLTVEGNTTLNKDLFVAGNQTIGGNSTILGSLTSQGMFYANGGLTVGAGQIVDMGGNRIQNVGAPIDGTDAVNLNKLEESINSMKDSLTDLGLKFSGNNGSTAQALGSTLNIVGGNATEGSYSAANLRTEVADGRVEIQMAENPEFNNVTMNNLNVTGNSTIGGNQTVAGNSTIGGNQNIAGNQTIGGNQNVVGDSNINGNLTVNGTTNLKDTIISGNQTVTGNSNIGGNQQIGGDLNVDGTTNLNDTVISGNTTIGGANTSFNIANGTKVDMGGNVISNITSGKVESGSRDAVTGDQLYQTITTLTDTGLTFAGNEGVTNRRLGETLNISGSLDTKAAASSQNVRTNVNAETGTVEILVSENPTFNSLTTNQDLTVKGNTTLGGENTALNVASGTSINMGNNVVDGVSDGDISPTSKQAVNGSQLYNVTQVLGSNATVLPNGSTVVNENGKEYTLTTYNVEGKTEYVTNSVVTAIHNMNEQGIKFFHTNDGEVKAIEQSKNTVDSSASGAYSTAIGFRATASGNNALAVGKDSTVSGDDSLSIGTGNVVTGNNSGAIGDPSYVDGDGSYSLGNNNHITDTADNSFVVGNENNVTTEDTYVVGSRVSQTADNSVFLGNDSGYVSASDTTRGNQAHESQSIAGQTYYYAGGAKNQVAGVVSVGNVTKDADGNQVLQTRRIQNVAPGLISARSTDAINGSQLYSAINNINLKFGDVNKRMAVMDRNLRSGIAGAVAIGSLVQAYNPSDSLLAVGGGTYRGSSAMAIGYSKVSDNGKVILKVTGSVNDAGHYMGGASVGFKF